MQKLKSFFSPRKIVVVILLLVLGITVPKLNAPAMSDTEAIVTMLCMDKQEDKIVMSATVLSPGPDNIANYQVFTGAGNTLGDAVEATSLAIGKEMGFAQCEVMAFGENLCDEGIMDTLDVMTRTKKVGRNAFLICFGGDINDFSEALSNLNKEKSLKLELIMNFDKRYILSKEGNIESFYIGYFNDTSLGIMPKVSIKNSEEDNAIEVAASGQTSGSGSEQNSGTQEKKYFINDGSVSIFKKGKRVLDVSPEQVKKINYFVNNSQQGTIEVQDVTDSIYNHANVVMDIVRKKNKISVSFEGNTPVFKSNIELVVFVEQVLEKEPQKNMLKRNNDFLTPAVIEKVKQKVIEDMQACVDFCRQNKIDMLQAYKHFSKLTPNKFEEYMRTTTVDEFLSGVKFTFDVKVTNEY